MKRVLAPGGLFLATVRDEFAAVLRVPGRKAGDSLKRGFYDDMSDHSPDGVVPEGYHRPVFQSKDYTLKKYSKYFFIVEYIERRGLILQDLAVIRKKILKKRKKGLFPLLATSPPFRGYTEYYSCDPQRMDWKR